MVKKRPKKSGGAKKSRDSSKSGSASSEDFNAGDDQTAATTPLQEQVSKEKLAITADNVQGLTVVVSSEVEKIKKTKDSDNIAIKATTPRTASTSGGNVKDTHAAESKIIQVENKVGSDVINVSAVGDTEIQLIPLKAIKSEKLLLKKIKERKNLSKIGKRHLRRVVSAKKPSDTLKSGSTSDISAGSVEAVEIEIVQTEAAKINWGTSGEVRNFGEGSDKVVPTKRVSACDIGTGSPQTATTDTVKEQDEEKLKTSKRKVDEILQSLASTFKQIDRAEKQRHDVVTLEDFRKALATVQKKEQTEDTAMEMITNIESDKIVIPKEKLESITMSSDTSDEIKIDVTLPTVDVVESTSVTLHPIDDCPVYSKLAEAIKRDKYQVCYPHREGYCDACETSIYTWPKIIHTNVFANSILAYTGKAPLNRLVFPDEESPPNGGGSLMEPLYEYNQPESFNLHNEGEYLAESTDGSEQMSFVETSTAPLRLEELFAVFEYSLRGICHTLQITKDVYYPSVRRPTLKPIKEEDEGNEQTNISDEIIMKSNGVEKIAEKATVSEQKSPKTAPKKRKLKPKKPLVLPPSRVRVPAMNYIQLRTQAGAEPLYTVTFGHILINIYNQQELAHAQRYHEEYLNSLLPSLPPLDVTAAGTDQSVVDENTVEIEEEEEEEK